MWGGKVKKIILLLAIAVSFGLVSLANADLLVYGGDHYVGQYTPNTPAGEEFEEGYVNFLITVADEATVVKTVVLPSGDTDYTYNRVDGISTPPGGFPTPVTFADKDESSPYDYIASGENYILGKYGGGQQVGYSLVWYSATGFTGSITLANLYDGKELSHISGFTTSVPEPMAMGLVGAGVLILGFVRRRIRK